MPLKPIELNKEPATPSRYLPLLSNKPGRDDWRVADCRFVDGKASPSMPAGIAQSAILQKQHRVRRCGHKHQKQRDGHDHLNVLEADFRHQQIAEAAWGPEHSAEDGADQGENSAPRVALGFRDLYADRDRLIYSRVERLAFRQSLASFRPADFRR